MTLRAEAAARGAYVDALLALYRAAPGTLGHVRKGDVRRARDLHDRGVSLQVIEDAITVALCRRLLHATPPAEPIRSLHYFVGVVDEILSGTLDPGYVHYLRGCLARHLGPSAAPP